MNSSDSALRKPPYAAPTAFRDFLERTRQLPMPARVDRNFLARLGIARSNEWSLTSALKFLGIIDDRGVPTADYTRLQGEDRLTTLRSLIERAYAPLLAHGGATMSRDELRNYFRVTSTPAQAQNATRFFRDLRDLAHLESSARGSDAPTRPVTSTAVMPAPPEPEHVDEQRSDLLFRAKLRMLELLPPRSIDWSSEEYLALFDRVLLVLKNLDETR